MIVNQLDIMLLMRNMLFVIKNLTGVEPNSIYLYFIKNVATFFVVITIMIFQFILLGNFTPRSLYEFKYKIDDA